MSIYPLLLLLLLIAALWTVLAADLLHAAIALAAVSVVLSLIMFLINNPLAAVFELSVCAGLITVVFVSTISLTRRLRPEEESARAGRLARRFVWLPLLVIAGAVAGVLFLPSSDLPQLSPPQTLVQARQVLWNLRRFDLIGQVLLILAGVFAVVVLFKPGESEK